MHTLKSEKYAKNMQKISELNCVINPDNSDNSPKHKKGLCSIQNTDSQ